VPGIPRLNLGILRGAPAEISRLNFEGKFWESGANFLMNIPFREIESRNLLCD
jgi:hypothetical protein